MFIQVKIIALRIRRFCLHDLIDHIDLMCHTVKIKQIPPELEWGPPIVGISILDYA